SLPSFPTRRSSDLRILRQDVVSGLGHRYRVGRPIHRQIGLMRIPTAPRFRMAPRARRIANEKRLRWLRDIGNSLMRPRILQDMKRLAELIEPIARLLRRKLRGPLRNVACSLTAGRHDPEL